MKTKLIMVLALTLLLCSGCQRGDMEITPVRFGQITPHEGWLLSPDMYLFEGDTVPLSGVVIRINGLEYDDLVK